jgi:uncharacterized protein
VERIVIGKTGLEVNRLGLGGIPIQRVDEAQAVETVLHAVESGVDFIDTARGYSTSERWIGMALQETDKKVVIASKSHDRTSDGIRADLEKSLQELHRDTIDLYQCHFVRNEQDYRKIISPGGALEGLRRAKEEGLIGHIGLSSHSLDLLDVVLKERLFETIMLCFSFLESAAEKRIIPKAIETGIGVIAMKPFSGGAIENPRLALKYVLSCPGIVVIPGVEEKSLFDENWRIFTGGHELEPEEKREIEQIRLRCDKTFCRRCDYCQPCTEEIPIQVVLGIKTTVKRLGLDAMKREMFKNACDKARACCECGECMTRCPYGLPIPDLLKENLRWVDERLATTHI